jgi:CHASE3 domain sensor protein
VTSRADDIHKLIADIDNLLAHGGKRLSKLLSGQGQEEREVLQRVRDFLVKMNGSEASGNESVSPVSSQLLERFVEQSQRQSVSSYYPSAPAQAAIEVEQLKVEFSVLLQPLKTEISDLLQERETLIQEIRQLEQKRLQNYSLTQQLAHQEQMISEFLQVLVNRLVPNLMPIFSQIMANIAASHPEGGQHQTLELLPTAIPPILESAERMEKLANLARELDQRLLSLDGTVNVVFESLEQNIKTYHESLSSAVANMHNQGLQGEKLIATLIKNLQQPLSSPSGQADSLSQLTVATNSNLEVGLSPTPETSTQLEDLSLFSNVPETSTPVTLADLDVVLSQLTGEPASVSTANDVSVTTPVQPANVVRGDAVEQLYASLFSSEESSSTAAEPTTQVASESPEIAAVPNLVESQPAAEDLSAPAVEEKEIELPTTSPTVLKSVEIEEEAEEADLDLLAPPEITEVQPSISAVSPTLLWIDTNDTTLGAAPSLPDGADTITVLTDLLIDSNVEVSPEHTPELTPSVPAAVPLDNYVPASPQENLLSLESSESPNIPEIILNEQQLERLNHDLADFDQQIGSSWQPTSPVESVPKVGLTENISSTPLDAVELPELETQVEMNPVSEKKKEATISASLNSLLTGLKVNDTAADANRVFDSVWYLGIDLGTTGISAALLNRATSIVYPICWSAETQANTNTFQESFRLPAEVYLPTTTTSHSEGENTGNSEQTSPTSVAQGNDTASQNLYSTQLKPYLQVAIPYKRERQKWEPVLQLNEFAAGPLIWVVRSLSKLLLTLKSNQTSTTPALIANAIGLDGQSYTNIINNLAGVICTCPSSWTEQYRFNVREAILASKLVSHPQQVFFIEEAIASLLPELDSVKYPLIQVSTPQGLRILKNSEHPLFGNTLVVNIGSTATEMALVDLPTEMEELKHQDFMLHSFAYAGKGIEQDIICQLLLPPKSRQSRFEAEAQGNTTDSNLWHWQPSIPGLDQMRWHSLGLEALEIPRVGEPDSAIRIRLQQRLESSILGQALLDAAIALKLILQHQETFILELADQRWILQRRDLESQVFVPFVRRLNRELNKLLVARGIPTEGINQAVLTGGVASVETVNRWLRQKLPNAKIIQDISVDSETFSSRVAYGLSVLPLHPQVLEVPRQQYTDYFLFTELLKLLPERTLSFTEVLQLFENRGINTRICQQRLLAFLEGELPPGLIPSLLDSNWLTQNSQVNFDYQVLAAVPLFEKQGNLTYRPNPQQVSSLRRYLDAIQASTLQSLEEPYLVNLGVEV